MKSLNHSHAAREAQSLNSGIIETKDHLTLIVPGDVKVELTDIDTELWETNFILYFNFKYLFLQKSLANLFFHSYVASKHDIWCTF